jgi:hypothetical protein
MNPLIKDIEDELKRTRLDKTRLYGLLTKIIENAGPAGPAGPIATPVVAKKEATPPVTEATPAKKVVTKKKVVASA